MNVRKIKDENEKNRENKRRINFGGFIVVEGKIKVKVSNVKKLRPRIQNE